MNTFNEHKFSLLLILAGPLFLLLSGKSQFFILTAIVLLEIPLVLTVFAQMGKYRTFTLYFSRLCILASIVFFGINIKKIISSDASIFETNIILTLLGILIYTIIYFSCKKLYTKIELKRIQRN